MLDKFEDVQYLKINSSSNSSIDSEMKEFQNVQNASEVKNSDLVVEDGLASRNMKNDSKRMLFENFTTIVHVLTIQFVIFILYLSFNDEVRLFTWHPVFLSVGWALLMTEAIITISNENILTKYVSVRKRVTIHWILQAIASICILIGFVVVVVHKNICNRPHFKTWHSTVGMASIVFFVFTSLLGVLTLYKIEFTRFVSGKVSKFLHIFFGSATFFLGTITLLLSLYSHWFTKKTGYTAQVFCFIMIFVIAVWVLIRPIKYLLNCVLHR